jgi:hypothetical protein
MNDFVPAKIVLYKFFSHDKSGNDEKLHFTSTAQAAFGIFVKAKTNPQPGSIPVCNLSH